jgi:WD40 repeat protein
MLPSAGRGGAREGGGSQAPSVVRVWELADAETKVQYAGHSAAVHKLAFLGPGSAAVASLDVSGAIHVWSRSTGRSLLQV